MDPIPKSDLFFPNKAARVAILSLEDILGKKGINTILHQANLSHVINHYPPDNLALEFDFSDFSSINWAVEELYGSTGGRVLGLHAGRTTFDNCLRNLGALGGVNNPAFRTLPLPAKLHMGIPAMARVFSQISDQLCTVEEQESLFVFSIHNCPVCWGRKTEQPACYFATGLLQAGIKWISSENRFHIVQNSAHSCGCKVCGFTIDFNPCVEKTIQDL